MTMTNFNTLKKGPSGLGYTKRINKMNTKKSDKVIRTIGNLRYKFCLYTNEN